MDELRILQVVLLGVVYRGHGWVSGSVLDKTARPGDTVILFCDCRFSAGAYITWFRNCSHENQPSLVMGTKYDSSKRFTNFLNPFPRFHLVKNNLSDSYDLMITNITYSDSGLYYCGTEQGIVEDKTKITGRYVYNYSNVITRILLYSSEPNHETTQDCGLCWMLLFSLCPTFAFASSLLSSLLVYNLCQKKAKKPQLYERRPGNIDQTGRNPEEDVCYTALEIRQTSQRPKVKKTQSSDFSTYSVINTRSELTSETTDII
ncbi:uncharacterized protein LOC113128340 [Mastacembelus armatus]|uniref:uncharacterized protein LOC113128340 n=1 Tax=Mastacembelus armatus TaxID=205130 RepID=UPI000E45CBD1|nr:uncharacterized protein LOC113128340 [Mastacembelus armatus]